jgi:hypothetical protein
MMAPFALQADRGAQDPLVQASQQACILRGRQQLKRGHPASEPQAVPADQRLHADEPARGAVPLGLQVQLQLVGGERLDEGLAQGHLGLGRVAQRWLEQEGRVAALRLRRLEREIGGPQKPFGIQPVIGRASHADAAGHGASGLAMARRQGEAGANALRHAQRVRGLGAEGQHGEFIPAQTRHQVGGAHGLTQPLRRASQQGIAGREAMPLVGGLQVIEVDKQQRAPLRVARHRIQPEPERGPVREPREGIMSGEVLDPFLAAFSGDTSWMASRRPPSASAAAATRSRKGTAARPMQRRLPFLSGAMVGQGRPGGTPAPHPHRLRASRRRERRRGGDWRKRYGRRVRAARCRPAPVPAARASAGPRLPGAPGGQMAAPSARRRGRGGASAVLRPSWAIPERHVRVPRPVRPE